MGLYNTTDIHKTLYKLGYLKSEVIDKDDPTSEGIKKFKADYELLPIDDEPDEAFQNKMAKVVEEMKNNLNAEICPEKPLNQPGEEHIYGDRTTQVVKDFQKQNNLAETGIANKFLREWINTLEDAWILITDKKIYLMSEDKYYSETKLIVKEKEEKARKYKEYEAKNIPAKWFKKPRNIIVSLERPNEPEQLIYDNVGCFPDT